MKGKLVTAVHIFNAEIHVEFDAEILPDGSLKLEYHGPIIIPKGNFQIVTGKDWR